MSFLPGIEIYTLPITSPLLIGAAIGSIHSALIFVLLNSRGETIFLNGFFAIKSTSDCLPSQTFALTSEFCSLNKDNRAVSLKTMLKSLLLSNLLFFLLLSPFITTVTLLLFLFTEPIKPYPDSFVWPV